MSLASCRPAALAARPAVRPARRHAVAVRASAPQQPKPMESMDDSNINEFCIIGPDGKRQKLSLGEKEQMFLEALSSYYYEEKPTLSDAEFENLKEDLVWSGSKVAVLDADEQRFLEAQLAYNRGAPIMSDAAFDGLKAQLKAANSVVAAEGPRCSISSRKMYSDASVDYLKMTAINIPAALIALAGLFSIDDLTGFEITAAVELPEPWGIIIVWGIVLPVVYVLANAITSAVFTDALILKAPCPSCGTVNTAYFGDILTIAGNRETATAPCSQCKASLTFTAKTRQVEATPAAAAPAK